MTDLSSPRPFGNQLKLLLAIDQLRDRMDRDEDIPALFEAIARLLKDYFHADASAILITDTNTQSAEMVISVGMPQDLAQRLCDEAMHYSKPQPLTASAWEYSLGLRILIDRERQVYGSLVLVRDDQPFDETEQHLLELAETQIDSAITQTRRLWELQDRNQELEAIYQIDRLRDDAIDDHLLFKDFTLRLTEYFHAASLLWVYQSQHAIETFSQTGATRIIIEPYEQRLIQLTQTIQQVQTLSAVEEFDYELIAAPLIVSGKRLGAVVLARHQAFRTSDHRLLGAIVSQMDSAIAHLRTARELHLRTAELEAIYQIDRIRDREEDFDQMLLAVLQVMCDTVNSETGYIMLYNAHDENSLELQACTLDLVPQNPEYRQVIDRISREALDSERLVTYNEQCDPLRSIMAVPLILNQTVIGVFGAMNSQHSAGFSDSDQRLLTAITSQVDTAVFERLERRRIRQVLGRSVDPKVLNALLARADDSLLTSERQNLSILFADLRGSTLWAEQVSPDELISSLNQFLSLMTRIVFDHGGTLDKFVGDQVIAIFGAPITSDEHTQQAVICAQAMRRMHSALQKQLASSNRYLPGLGIGIASGEAIVGEIGPEQRTDYTAIGRVVNLGSRLCDAATAGQILISEETYRTLKDSTIVHPLDPIEVKGIMHPVAVYELIDTQE